MAGTAFGYSLGVPETTSNALLGRSARGQDVIHLQSALAAAGVFDTDVDGVFGSATESALRIFQTQKKLNVTGSLTHETAQALEWKPWKPAESRVPEITVDLVSKLCPQAPRSNIEANLSAILNALAARGMADIRMILMALATIRVETSLFLPVSELPSSFNTSPGGKPFDLYDKRPGLGNQGPPDGAKFRGRGFIQLTGRANYQRFGQELGMESQLLTSPELAHEANTAARLLAAFLKTREARIRTALAGNRLADARKLVNGGTNGLTDFTTAFNLGRQLLPQQVTVRA